MLKPDVRDLILKVSPQEARTLYHQGHTVCSTDRGYSLIEEAQKTTKPVGENFFHQEVQYALLMLPEEGATLRKHQLRLFGSSFLATGCSVVCLNLLLFFMMTNKEVFITLFFIVSYGAAYGWVRLYSLTIGDENEFRKIFDKYGL